MDTIDLGAARLHLVVAHPGLPGEADRVVREIGRLAPVVVLADLGTDEGLRLREAVDRKTPFEPHYVDALFADESHRRFAGDAPRDEDPFVAAARDARAHKRSFVPMRASGGGLGLFARRRAKRAASEIAADTPEAFAGTFAEALWHAHAWDATPEAAAMQQRAVRTLQEGRAPVAALIQAHRAPAFRSILAETGRVAP